jgi:diguanylate cyclase (GGDEF)-like protein
MHAPVAMISLVDRDRQWFKSRQGTDLCETARDISFCTHTIEKDEPMVVSDTLNDPRFRDNPLVAGPSAVRSYIGVPLRTSTGHRIGALCVNDVVPREASQAQLDCLQDLARLVVDEIELRKLASVDSLTGAEAARAFLTRGKAEFNRARRHDLELGCIVFDLDHFKRVNDTYGHGTGDQVLTEAVSLCRALIRSSDVIGRIGGEEFAILLPETPGTMATKIAEALRESISLLNVQHLGHVIRLTASFGVASLVTQDPSFRSVLARADAAMYEAKIEGRNKVATGTPPKGTVVKFRHRA